MKHASLLKAFLNSAVAFVRITPMLLGLFLLVGLLDTLVSEELWLRIFSADPLYDTLLGAAAGSFSVGQPVTSYLIGSELRDSGVSMYAVSAFIISWASVGMVQLPLEMRLFGLRFALQRNLLAFIFSLLISFASVETLKLFS